MRIWGWQILVFMVLGVVWVIGECFCIKGEKGYEKYRLYQLPPQNGQFGLDYWGKNQILGYNQLHLLPTSHFM